jgi:hypothetical protein
MKVGDVSAKIVPTAIRVHRFQVTVPVWRFDHQRIARTGVLTVIYPASPFA